MRFCMQELTSIQRATLLRRMADALLAHERDILDANAMDVSEAKASGVAAPLQARLSLTPTKLAQLAEGIRAIAGMEEPIGRQLSDTIVADGLELEQVKITCPRVCADVYGRVGEGVGVEVGVGVKRGIGSEKLEGA